MFYQCKNESQKLFHIYLNMVFRISIPANSRTFDLHFQDFPRPNHFQKFQGPGDYPQNSRTFQEHENPVLINSLQQHLVWLDHKSLMNQQPVIHSFRLSSYFYRAESTIYKYGHFFSFFREPRFTFVLRWTKAALCFRLRIAR